MVARILVDQLKLLEDVKSLGACLLPLDIPKRVVVPTVEFHSLENIEGIGYCFEQILILIKESFLSRSVEVNQREGWVVEVLAPFRCGSKCFADNGVFVFGFHNVCSLKYTALGGGGVPHLIVSSGDY